MKKFLKQILSFVFVVLFSITSFVACSAPGSSSAGPGISQGGGSGGGGSNPGGDIDYSDIKTQLEREDNPDNQFETLYQGVYVISEANDSTMFFDNVTNSSQTY